MITGVPGRKARNPASNSKQSWCAWTRLEDGPVALLRCIRKPQIDFGNALPLKAPSEDCLPRHAVGRGVMSMRACSVIETVPGGG